MIQVLSVKDETPILGCQQPLVRGKSHQFILDATLWYKFRGDDDPFEVSSYTWNISSGGENWTYNSYDYTMKKLDCENFVF